MTNTHQQRTTGRTLGLLAERPRRRAIRHLEKADSETTIGWLARSLTSVESGGRTEGAALERCLIELHHVHLPALSDNDVITYNTETGVVRRGPQFEEAVSLLSAVDMEL